MKHISLRHFYSKLSNKKDQQPLNGQIELTYRCNLNCIHCYCKGLEDTVSGNRLSVSGANRKAQTANRELTTEEWKEILDEIHREGCIQLTFTGGEPLIRDDFLEIYAYAKEKGFIITLFTNGQAFTDEIIDYLIKSPVCSIEITLNGITKDIYEAVTQIEGSFERVMDNIKRLKENKIPLILKTNCLKQNKHEVVKIKRWTEEFLGKPSDNRHHFKYDQMIYPRLNHDKTPCNYRLSLKELLDVKKQDPDIWREYKKGLDCGSLGLKRGRQFLYQCDSWTRQFFINPYGYLKFCIFSDDFSINLKTTTFKEGFYKIFPKLLNEKFKTNSKCKDCRLRPICYYCPARAYLETGDAEVPVEYFCQLAEETAREMQTKLPNC